MRSRTSVPIWRLSITINPAHPTAALGRNTGWRRTTSDFILFLDGDTILHSHSPPVAYSALSMDESIAAVWGHRREMNPERSVFNRVLDLDWIYPPGFTEFFGGDVLVRRAALVETGGFDDGLIAGKRSRAVPSHQGSRIQDTPYRRADDFARPRHQTLEPVFEACRKSRSRLCGDFGPLSRTVMMHSGPQSNGPMSCGAAFG